MYATVDDVILKLGLTNVSGTKRIQIQRYLDWTANEITAIIGNVILSQKTETINICDISRNFTTFYLNNIEVKEIREINGKPYTGVKGTDYTIMQPQNRKVIMNDLYSYCNNVSLGVVTVTYMSGFAPIPQDIVFAHVLLVDEELQKQGGQNILSYKMGPRTIKYATDADISSSRKGFESYLNKYRILHF